MKGTIDLLFDVANENGKPQKNVAVKNNAPFGSCISKINNTLTDNAEDPDTVMPMYNLLECSQNHSMTSGSLWNYYRDEIGNVDNYASDGKSFKYKRKTVGKTPERPETPERPLKSPETTLNDEVTIPLKCLCNFGDFLIYY